MPSALRRWASAKERALAEAQRLHQLYQEMAELVQKECGQEVGTVKVFRPAGLYGKLLVRPSGVTLDLAGGFLRLSGEEAASAAQHWPWRLADLESASSWMQALQLGDLLSAWEKEQ